ncbi:MAG: hypothetical protein ACLPN5_12045 [Roseiarcus sp.]
MLGGSAFGLRDREIAVALLGSLRRHDAGVAQLQGSAALRGREGRPGGRRVDGSRLFAQTGVEDSNALLAEPVGLGDERELGLARVGGLTGARIRLYRSELALADQIVEPRTVGQRVGDFEARRIFQPFGRRVGNRFDPTVDRRTNGLDAGVDHRLYARLDEQGADRRVAEAHRDRQRDSSFRPAPNSSSRLRPRLQRRRLGVLERSRQSILQGASAARRGSRRAAVRGAAFPRGVSRSRVGNRRHAPTPLRLPSRGREYASLIIS